MHMPRDFRDILSSSKKNIAIWKFRLYDLVKVKVIGQGQWNSYNVCRIGTSINIYYFKAIVQTDSEKFT